MKAPSERHRRLPRAGPVCQRPRSPRPGEGEPAMTEAQLSGEPDGCQEHLTATETLASAIDALHEVISVAGPLERIELWRSLRERIDEGLDEAVAGARLRGDSWENIGRAAGMTRQAAHGRWAKVLEPVDTGEPDGQEPKAPAPWPLADGSSLLPSYANFRTQPAPVSDDARSCTDLSRRDSPLTFRALRALHPVTISCVPFLARPSPGLPAAAPSTTPPSMTTSGLCGQQTPVGRRPSTAKQTRPDKPLPIWSRISVEQRRWPSWILIWPDWESGEATCTPSRCRSAHARKPHCRGRRP
jgi:hypothetical protein